MTSLRHRLNDHVTMVRVGAAGLLLANLSQYFLHPTGDFWRGVADGVTGALFGIAIACLLLSLRSARRCSPDAG